MEKRHRHSQFGAPLPAPEWDSTSAQQNDRLGAMGDAEPESWD
jgi:hypothetical protein